MQPKTPQFDALLQPILDALVPHTRTCRQKDISKYCEGDFDITETDIEFLRMFRVPPPPCCPTCRRQRRYAYNNPVHFYKRKNDAPEATMNIISFVPPNSPLKVFDYEYYLEGDWSPLTYGKLFEKEVGFLEQLYTLRLAVPQPAITRDPSNINSDYSINGKNSKNAYCSSAVFGSEDIWYTLLAHGCREIMDSQAVRKSEQLYNAVRSRSSSQCSYIYFTQDCINSHFLYDCRNCQDCFGCVNLRNKRYYFFNKELTKEEYNEKVASMKMQTRSGVAKILPEFWALVYANPVKASRNENAIDCSGVAITNSKDCTHVTDCEKSEHERYADSVIGHKDSMDIYGTGGSELLYETSGVGSGCSNVKFSAQSKNITDSEYILNCRQCDHCFASVGLQNKSFVIFNKQFTEEEYYIELDRVKMILINSGEYGELFDFKFSPFAYNGSFAGISYPLSEEEIKMLGALWQPDVDSEFGGIATVNARDVPDSIDDAKDDILDKAIICEESGRPFRIIPSELQFYRRWKIPVPIIHPYRRMKDRYKYSGAGRSYHANCSKCNVELETIYSDQENWILYCDQCFQEEIL